jgi:hypothetical protein
MWHWWMDYWLGSAEAAEPSVSVACERGVDRRSLHKCFVVLAWVLLTTATILPAQDFTADTRDMEATLGSLYDVISGEAGVVRDETRFRNLFWPGATLSAIRTDSTGKRMVRVMSVDDFYKGMSEFVKTNSFHEKEIARRVESWDGIAHVWSTYEIRKHQEDAEPFARGINSIQLFRDGQRWWVMSIYWQPESKEVVLPKDYVRKGKVKP